MKEDGVMLVLVGDYDPQEEIWREMEEEILE